jgi:hypothetical protein
MESNFIPDVPLGRIERNRNGEETISNVLENLKYCGYRVSEPRKISGYISRKCAGIISRYNGLYGTGYKIEIPSFAHTGYHFIIYAAIPEKDSK